MRQGSSAGNVRTQTSIREKGQRSTPIWFARKIKFCASNTFRNQLHRWAPSIWLLYPAAIPLQTQQFVHSKSVCVCVFICLWFCQQWRTPAQKSCWGSCRRRGPVRCAWTNWCPSSSSPVVIWWCAVIALQACVTAPSAEPSLEAAFVLSCPKAEVRSHSYTGVEWVALSFSLYSFSLVMIQIKIIACFVKSLQIIYIL